MYEHNRRSSRCHFQRPIKDLLFDQQNGRYLTSHEKKEIQKYAQERRKINLKKAA